MPAPVLNRGLRIGLLHPDLGLGGAERVVVDAARAMQAAGHRVTLFTARHDRSRCFEETVDGSLDVQVVPPIWPTQVFQRLRAPCTILRMTRVAATVVERSGPFDVLFCDLVPHIIPLLKRRSEAKIVFYCHFPDLLLTQRKTLAYRVYRRPIDRLETSGMSLADAVLVNSRFTAATVAEAFPEVQSQRMHVVYPGVDPARYATAAVATDVDEREIVVLSLNRYRPEKNHGLAIVALSVLRQRVPGNVFAGLRLVIAGGFDASHSEERQTLRQLQQQARDLGLTTHVTFVQSCSESERLQLLSRCRCLVYTPVNEHFGLAPVEAMAAGRPVVATDSGGPLETIRNQETGFLCQPTADAFADALARLILDRNEAQCMGQAGRRHIREHFSITAFGERLSAVLDTLNSSPDRA